jgi:methylated-DNA-[protein]-cysteine S-methyltransferase
MMLFFRDTAIGKIGIASENGAVTRVLFATDAVPQNAEIGETDVIREAFRQLEAYFSGELQTFTVPLAPHGTDFMCSVWKALCNVPFGKTASYKDIALAVGNPKAVRAVGQANNKNPIPLFIPCQRVIGSNGTLTGYRGGLEMKKKLLELERGYVGGFSLICS